MYETDNGAGPPAGPGYRLPERGQLPDLPLYERLIADGVAAADSRSSIVDHLTCERTCSPSCAKSSSAMPSPSGSPAALTKPLNYWASPETSSTTCCAPANSGP